MDFQTADRQQQTHKRNMDANMEIGLKSQIKRQVYKKEWEMEKGLHARDCLIEMWKEYQDCFCILATDARRWETTLEEQIWKYVEKYSFSIKINSSHFGLKTIIKDYTNAKGETKPAHYTQRGWYYGSIKQLGSEPVFYEGNFEINKTNFKISLDRLCELKKIGEPGGEKHYPLSVIFFPKESAFTANPPDVSENDESDDDEKPLAPPPPKKTLKIVPKKK